MVSKAVVEDFLGQKSIALVGVSRSEKKFGNNAYAELVRMGYGVYAVHPEAKRIGEIPCYPSLAALPEKVGGVLVVVQPDKAEQVLRDAHEAGITRIWMQPGSESDRAIEYANQNGMTVVSGLCILMYAQPQLFFHKVHRWINGALGMHPC